MKNFNKGQVVAYCPKDTNGDIYKVEIGIVKYLARDLDHVFVCYHAGETAASTNKKDLYEVSNGSYLQNFLEIWGGSKNEYKQTPPPAQLSDENVVDISPYLTGSIPVYQIPKAKADLCPVCKGGGKYTKTENVVGSTGSYFYQTTCHGCNGKGWVIIYD